MFTNGEQLKKEGFIISLYTLSLVNTNNVYQTLLYNNISSYFWGIEGIEKGGTRINNNTRK